MYILTTITITIFGRFAEAPLNKEFASVDPELYKLVAITNPTLKLFFAWQSGSVR
jgi:hypothetical protein